MFEGERNSVGFCCVQLIKHNVRGKRGSLLNYCSTRYPCFEFSVLDGGSFSWKRCNYCAVIFKQRSVLNIEKEERERCC